MFPLGDENPTLERSITTYVVIALNVLLWIFLQNMGMGQAFIQSLCRFGLIPAELLGNVQPGTAVSLGRQGRCVMDADPGWFTAVSSMFMHGGWLHLIGNMWFLAIFGDNVEDSMGHFRFVLFYLVCGLAAVAAQVVSNPQSTVPMVGASGAIGGVMGAYAVLYPKARVHMLVFLGFFITRIIVPAYFMLGYWFIIQLLSAIPSGARSSGVAFWAHIGGFIAGAVLIFIFKDPRRMEKRSRIWSD
jgi:membrane associated rhomboid family serine protease